MQLFNLLCKYKDIFRDRIALSNKFEYDIKMYDNEPVIKRSYNTPFNLLPQIEQEVQRMLDLKEINEAQTAYISPCVIVHKKNYKIRYCLDARFVNKRMIPDAIALQPIDNLLYKCKGSQFYSSLDFKESFWQVKLTEKAKQYTGFQFKNKIYVYNVISYGLKNSQSVSST